ncbi:hypothetical protein [Enterococcus sp. HY326]|uniref:hypothetical protein n=1 Tax=Enterococcus sp. HY326 TaxID=2971265 RepID=UPI00223F2288|nr:hypothetical protein [Enterococcus sp. HY326]
MFENPFAEKITALRAGELSEIVVTREEFLVFRDVWKELPDKKDIVGEAGLEGKIIYRYQPESQVAAEEPTE